MQKILITLWMLALTASCTPESQPVLNSLFDGVSLAGWEGNQTYFRLEDQAIVAGSATDSIPQNEFLCTEQEYGDFELRLEVQMNEQIQNGGIQFRSARIPNDNEVIGYQCDVGYLPDRPIWASLYDESRRRRFLMQPEADLIRKLLKPNAWNEMVIRCEGSEIRFWFNGQEVLHYQEEDPDIARSGIICVQIHSGPPAEIRYRNIQLNSL